MDFWNINKLKQATDITKTVNIDGTWTSSGIKIWHEGFCDGNMLVMREKGETRGEFKRNLGLVKGKIAALVTTNADNYADLELPIIEVPDTNKFIVDMGQYIRKCFRGKIVAITGSSGKSTTTKMLYDVLKKYKASANLTSENTVHGISWHMTNFDVESKYWVIETSIGRGAITIPDVAIITNVAPVHLTENQTIEVIARAKSRIFDTMSEGKTAIIYRETECFDIFYNAAMQKKLNIITVGESADSTVKINGNSIQIKDKNYNLGNDFIAKHLIIDMALALATVDVFGENTDTAIQELLNFKELSGRGETFEGNIQPNKKITLIDESYNANPLSMQATLKAFAEKYKDRNKVLILGDMAEGGKESDKQHLELVDIIRKVNPQKIILVGKSMPKIAEKLENTEIFEDCLELNKNLLRFINDGDAVFIKSSHSVGLYKTVNVIKNFMNNFKSI